MRKPMSSKQQKTSDKKCEYHQVRVTDFPRIQGYGAKLNARTSSDPPHSGSAAFMIPGLNGGAKAKTP